jgi:hypothetical protein
VLAGPRDYLTARNPPDLVELRLLDGHETHLINTGDVAHFPSQVVDGGLVFVPTLSGITAFRG